MCSLRFREGVFSPFSIPSKHAVRALMSLAGLGRLARSRPHGPAAWPHCVASGRPDDGHDNRSPPASLVGQAVRLKDRLAGLDLEVERFGLKPTMVVNFSMRQDTKAWFQSKLLGRHAICLIRLYEQFGNWAKMVVTLS